MTEVIREQWVMKFNGSFIANSGGVEVVLYHKGEETMALSFKLEFTREKRPWHSHSSWSFLVQKIPQNTRPILLG